MNSKQLINQIDLAFDAGKNQFGLELLREYNSSNFADAASWYRQAVVEEQIGDWAAAGNAYYKCIELAPHISTAYLYAGYWLEQSNHLDAASSLYSLCQEIDPNLLIVNASSSQVSPTILRSKSGSTLLRTHLSNQHRMYANSYAFSKRIRGAIWAQTHDKPVTYRQGDFAPNLFYIPDLPQKPYYEKKEFNWTDSISQNSSIIIDELNTALDDNAVKKQLRPYLAKEFHTPESLANLAGSKEWSALDLFRDGKQNSVTKPLFKKTLELISSIPTYSLDETPFEVFFSLLKPGQEISPHYGQSNHSLTVHLALEIPPDCFLEVAGEQRKWEKGELIIFDDSYLHSAHNQSDEIRIVLIFSVWHPSLSKDEHTAIQQCFKLRQQWMSKRTTKLQQLQPE